MPVTEIMTMISSIGFPAAFCVIMLIMGGKAVKLLTDAMSKTTEALHNLSERIVMIEALIDKKEE